jgi:hypothetical protein
LSFVSNPATTTTTSEVTMSHILETAAPGQFGADFRGTESEGYVVQTIASDGTTIAVADRRPMTGFRNFGCAMDHKMAHLVAKPAGDHAWWCAGEVGEIWFAENGGRA